MRSISRHLTVLALPLFLGAFVAVQAHGKARPDAKAELEAEVKANLAKLSAEDRRVAEDQRFCAVEGEESRLGAMGVPIKVMVQGKPVFICCKGCRKQALSEPDKTLAKAEEFKKKFAGKK